MNFPLLDANGKRLVYLDNAATTQKPSGVIDAITRFYTEQNSNIHRGVYGLAIEATEAYENARKRVAKCIGATSEQLVFTSGTTESLNMIADWAATWLAEGDEIIVTVMEHHANLVPWQQVGKRTGAKLLPIGITEDRRLDMDAFSSALGPRTKLVCVTHASNVLGTINPIAEIIKSAHEKGARVIVDGAQVAGHLPVDFDKLGADFYVFSGHKMFGPTGIGALVIKDPEKFTPTRYGGEMIEKVSLTDATWADIPHRFEAGTPNIAGAIGFGAAVEYVKSVGVAVIHKKEELLARAAWSALAKIPEVKLFGVGPDSERTGVVSFTVDGVHPHDVAQILDEHGVAIRTGHHCAEPLIQALGVDALCRASFAVYNTEEDIDALVAGVLAAIKLFKGDSGDSPSDDLGDSE